MKKLTVISVFILIQTTCFTQIIHIPADYPTIQSGIDAANTGDTVLVDQGTYYENINFMGKAITVASHYIEEADSSHIYNTVIDGSQSLDPDIGSVVTFSYNEDTTSCLYGFTITGGTGTKTPYFFPVNVGGGINFYNAGGKLESNIIKNNECILDTLDGGVYGGGIASGPPGTEQLVVIRENVIQNNQVWTKGASSAWDKGWAEGGAMQIAYNAIIENNLIKSNSCQSNNGISVGGAIRVCADPMNANFQALAVIRNNQVLDNKSISETFGAFSGGISCSAGNTIIENNTIKGNTVESQNYCRGAGLYFDLINSYYAVVNNNIISDNVSISPNSIGGAIGLYQSVDIEICNNIVENNSADNGGAFSINASQPRLIANNTILNNTASLEGGSYYIYESSEVEILNSILRNNYAYGFPNEIYYESGSSFSIQFSNIMGGWSGDGNIDENPLFLGSGDHPYKLTAGSPCIDEGTPDTSGLSLPYWDIIGNMRIWDGDNNGTEIIDMGAYEFEWPSAYNEFSIPISKLKVRNYPNPVHTKTTIEFILPKTSFVLISVIDLSGAEVGKLVSEKFNTGKHKFEWNTEGLNEGVYFIRLEVNGIVETCKAILLK